MNLNEIANEAKKIEKEIGLTTDDVLNKLTQELGEFNDAVQKFRGRYCKRREETVDKIKEEAGDLIINFISILKSVGINPEEISKFAENTLKKFKERKELYIKSLEKY